MKVRHLIVTEIYTAPSSMGFKQNATYGVTKPSIQGTRQQVRCDASS